MTLEEELKQLRAEKQFLQCSSLMRSFSCEKFKNRGKNEIRETNEETRIEIKNLP